MNSRISLSIAFYALLCLPSVLNIFDNYTPPRYYSPYRYRSRLPVGVCIKQNRTVNRADDSYDYDYESDTKSFSTVHEYVCCTGYREILSGVITTSPSMIKCEPICRDCKHGQCYRPALCLCHVGYRKERVWGSCAAECTGVQNHCLNGVCVSPNHCKPVSAFPPDSCFNDYCFNGCSVNGTCLCIGGYRKINESYCEPICKNWCRHGYCAAPDMCECDDGYEFDASSVQCVAICAKGCLGGTCAEPNVCRCKIGARLESTGELDVCVDNESDCHPCPNVTCTHPGLCRCGSGYALINSTCTPVCDNVTCVNGYCAAPNKCDCSPNYRPLANQTDVCEPICDPICLRHGNCLDERSCRCDPGYEKNTFRPMECVPICHPTCRIGEKCMSPGECRCKEGYVSDNGRCKPHCRKPCVYGTCIIPDMCLCRLGFSNTNGTCIRDYNETSSEAWCVTATNSSIDELADFRLRMQFNSDRNNWTFDCAPNCAIHCSNLFVYVNKSSEFVWCNFTYQNTHSGVIRCFSKILNQSQSSVDKQVCRPTLYHSKKTRFIAVASSSFNVSEINKLNSIATEENRCSMCPCWATDHSNVSIFRQPSGICPCSSLSYNITDLEYGQDYKTPKMTTAEPKGLAVYIFAAALITTASITLIAAAIYFYRNKTDYRIHKDDTDYIDKTFSNLPKTRNVANQLITGDEELED